MWNDKALRLRLLRDKLHLTGTRTPTVKQTIDILIEILGWIHSPRNLTYCRREFAKVRARLQEPTAEEIKLFAMYEDRLAKKAELIEARKQRRLEKKSARKFAKKLTPAAAPAATTPGGVVTRWD